MKVLHIMSSLGKGGRERQLYELMNGLKNVLDTSLIVLDNDFAYEVDKIGIPLFSINRKDRKRPATNRAVLRYIKAFNPDIIHYWDYVSLIYALEARVLRKIILIDGSIRYAGKEKRPLFTRFMKKISYNIADQILANSYAGLKVEGVYGKNKASVIHNGIDLGRFVPEQGFDALSMGIESDSIKIIMVAGIKPVKDYITLVQAAEVLCASYNNIQFLFVGDGEDREKVEKAVPDSIRARILFPGMRDDVEQLVLNSDIGVLLSSKTEGFSNSIMEYMAAGLPVIATRAGGTPELVLEGETGFLVDNFSVDQVVTHLKTLIEDPILRSKMGTAGKERIEQGFSIGRMVEKHIGLYNTLMTKSLVSHSG